MEETTSNETQIFFAPDEIPALSPPSVLARWTRKENHLIRKGSTIAEVHSNGLVIFVAAPVDGKLNLINVFPGERVMPGDSIGTIKPIAIAAECYDDLFHHRVTFDSVDWFVQASDQEIMDLAECGWGGNLPADAVAEFFENKNDDIDRVFKAVRFFNNPRWGYKRKIGFECQIEEDSAVNWLRVHRPNIYKKINPEEEKGQQPSTKVTGLQA